MARKNILTYAVARSQSLSASFQTEPTVINYLDNFSYQIAITTSDSEGTFSVQVSNNYSQTNPGIWDDLTLGSLGEGTPSVSAENDSIIISLHQLPFSVMRLAYTSSTAGTGTVDIYLTCKQVGG